MAGMAGLEPTQCQNQNLVPYQLGDIPTSSARPIIKRFALFVKRKNKKNKKIFFVKQLSIRKPKFGWLIINAYFNFYCEKVGIRKIIAD